MTGRLEGRVCVVAGSGGALGGAVAARFGAEGGLVVGVDRIEPEVGRLRLQADLACEAEVEAAYARVWREFGRLDVVYNNAGLINPGDHSALDLDMAVWSRVIEANLTTAWLSCKYAVPLMLRSEPVRGSVINTSSFLAGMGAASAQMAFNVAKAGVEQLSRDLGVNLARKGVRVNALALGPVETPQLRETFARLGPDEAQRRFVHMPLGRFATLDELAATAAYLASDDSGFVTASAFPLDGGIRGAFTTPQEAAPGEGAP